MGLWLPKAGRFCANWTRKQAAHVLAPSRKWSEATNAHSSLQPQTSSSRLFLFKHDMGFLIQLSN